MSVATKSIIYFISIAVIACYSVSTPADTPDRSRAQIIKTMLHFVKWQNTSLELSELTFCFLEPQLIDDKNTRPAQIFDLLHASGTAEQAERFIRFRDVQQMQLHLANDRCHVFYANFSALQHLDAKFISDLSRSTLTISDQLDFLDYGGIAALNYESQRIRLYINRQQLEQSDVNFASRLLQVARFYPEAP